MTLVVGAAALEERRSLAVGLLAPLAHSLARDLEPVMAAPLFVPPDKARLSRAGGRCPRDGTALDFDPFSPRLHRCPRCRATYDDEAHYRYWLMWYQLWLAERSTHAAALHALGGSERHRAFAAAVLESYVERYPRYPNSDNVLGPSRLFFSTYLESLWLLQLCMTLDLLETGAPGDSGHDTVASLGARVRDGIIAPAAALIMQYDEGTSNRQAWNCAALMAAARLTGDVERFDSVAATQLEPLLSAALLADGSWYEGENYHVFAHRGLWYGVTMAEVAGRPLSEPLLARFDAGFAIPFLTALPDMTMLARRDSQYAISLRQWRFAELCELGLARRDNPLLRGVLGRLYGDPSIPASDSGRARSPGEAERHAPAATLSRASLGWRSLLHAKGEPGPLEGRSPGSVLLPNQGLAVLRREHGRVMVALDYGESGGGHGHPDRLNLVLSDGDTRWLDDPGTGSYVDRSLHWYRSTLAHSAPLVERRSQRRVSGRLLAFDERGGAGWVAAAVDGIAPDVRVERRVVAMPDYLVDELAWTADAAPRVALPVHFDADVDGVDFHAATLAGGTALEDGFDFVSGAERATPGAWPLRLRAIAGGAKADVWLNAPAGTVLWRVRAPGPPGTADRSFHMLESSRPRGTFTTVIAWRHDLADVQARDAGLVIRHADGSVHEHASAALSWRVEMRANGARSSIDLGGAVLSKPKRSAPAPRPVDPPAPLRLVRASRIGGREARFELGEHEYRRSEQSWAEAGSPRAVVHLELRDDALAIAVESCTGPPVFVAEDAVNDMDNEQPDVNGSGVQLYLATAGAHAGWLLRPSADGFARTRLLFPSSPAIAATWGPTPVGWRLSTAIPFAVLGDRAPWSVALGLIVNEIPPGRERRRGQLVLGGAAGEWVYLRGDRHDPPRFLPIIID